MRDSLRLAAVIFVAATLVACDPSYLIEPRKKLTTDCGGLVVSDKPAEGRMMLMWYIGTVAYSRFCNKGMLPTEVPDAKLPFQHAAETHLAGTNRSHCRITSGTVAGIQSVEFTYACPTQDAGNIEKR
jgi:hypothetical protein